MSGKTKFIAATVLAAGLLATVAVARTVHTHTTAAPANASATHATVGAAPQSALRPHSNFACAPSVQADCDKLDWFPE
jgi:hypothetical protein